MGSKFLLISLVLFLGACTPMGNHVPPAADVSKAYKADWPQKAYTDILVAALNEHGKALLAAKPKDLSQYCASTDMVQCYVAIISSMARYESSFKTETKYKEGFNDVKGVPVYSRGLLQISIESANGNYACGFKNEEEIHDPQKHLPCVVKMAQKLILRDNQVTYPLGRYWSVMRAGHKNQRIEAIKKRSKELSGG